MTPTLIDSEGFSEPLSLPNMTSVWDPSPSPVVNVQNKQQTDDESIIQNFQLVLI